MSGRFAILAEPARYGVSRMVFGSELGAATAATAASLTAFDPDDSWRALK
jgi:DUF2950 family protein